MTPAETTSEILLNIEAVKINLQKPFIFTSGIKSPVYVDCRRLMRYPQQRETVARLLANKIYGAGYFDVIAGTATAGIPHAAWVAERLEKPMVYVRSDAKRHGTQSQIEGIIKEGEKVAVVEDLLSTGNSSITTVKALREVGGIVEHVFAIMTYGMDKADENFAVANVRPIVLATFETVVVMALQQGRIAENQKQIILDWAQDPPGWGKKMGYV